MANELGDQGRLAIADGTLLIECEGRGPVSRTNRETTNRLFVPAVYTLYV